MKLPVKYSTAQKLKALSLKAQDRSIPFSERSKIKDQYNSLLSSSYAKGGAVKASKIKLKKK